MKWNDIFSLFLYFSNFWNVFETLSFFILFGFFLRLFFAGIINLYQLSNYISVMVFLIWNFINHLHYFFTTFFSRYLFPISSALNYHPSFLPDFFPLILLCIPTIYLFKLTYTFYICAGAVMYSDSECEIEEPCPNSSRIRYIQLPASILGNTMNPSHLMSRTYSCKIVIFKTS